MIISNYPISEKYDDVISMTCLIETSYLACSFVSSVIELLERDCPLEYRCAFSTAGVYVQYIGNHHHH
jgi:hypothetical protein